MMAGTLWRRGEAIVNSSNRPSWAELLSRGSPATILLPERSAVFRSRLVWSSEELMRYAVVLEKARNNYSAYVPDLPGCVATATTIEETERLIREAIDLHLSGLRKDGLPIPQASFQVEYVEIST